MFVSQTYANDYGRVHFRQLNFSSQCQALEHSMGKAAQMTCSLRLKRAFSVENEPLFEHVHKKCLDELVGTEEGSAGQLCTALSFPLCALVDGFFFLLRLKKKKRHDLCK